MRRTAALVLALPLVLLTAAALAGPTGTDDVGAHAPPAAAPRPPAVPPAVAPTPPVAPSPPVAPEPTEAEARTEGAPDAEGTVEATDQREDDAGEPTDDAAATAAEERGPVESTFLIASVPDAGAVAGTGPRWRYTIEVEPLLGVDVEALAVEVRAALTDDRSWVRTRTLEQVDDPARARIRVVLASPDTVDELCGRVGLRTAGIYSCWNGRFAALNSWRWEAGADAFDDITTYRNYLVNHEFGHGLGYGHVGCPAEGAPAPVMMQQSKGVDACVANGWPYP